MSYALITGASKGIGKSIAYILAAKKINLILTARSEDLLKILCDDLSKKYAIDAQYFCADLANENAPEQVFDWVNTNRFSVNILVNNAGYGLSGSFEKYSALAHADMMRVNMTSLVKLTSLFLPVLKQQPQSYILNIASAAAYQAVPYLSVYAASKSFVLSFSRGLGYELKDTNVSVTCISPGGTETDFGNRAEIGEKAIKAGKKLNMDPDEVASIAVDSMFKKKPETITGLINKFGAFMTWLAPKRLTEKVAGGLYK